MTEPSASSITFTSGDFTNNGTYYVKDTVTATECYYKRSNNAAGYGILLEHQSNGSTKIYANAASNGANPPDLLILNGGTPAATVIVSNTNIGHVLSGTQSNGNVNWVFTISSAHLWSGTPPSTGPTVSSITVANQIASTRQFTVAHTGTLSSNDIDYKINGVDISSLGSPNTPITNIQSTSTGSTFDSYTIAKNGTHIVTIGTETLSFYVNTSTASGSTTELSAANLTVTFPTSESAWLQHVSNNYLEVYLYSNAVVFYGKLHGNSLDPRILEYLRIGTTYTSNTNSALRGFYWKLETWDFATADSATGKSYTFTTSNGYIDPVALNESTSSPNTTIPVSGHFLTNSTFTWDFASENAQATTTSNGGGKPDRYPLIMTNLFNRNRSIYSIGMTHKDTWDLFL